ncbi:gluconate 2-dehydrogenase subunit 3 family protein [Lapillicoccus jejuensis]|uniref:gluconate 2-dehydrogenase subunit 3 family protein n=1 Tax=Lapillicoccus jejuensis TaxID=402171 RepID=UPI0031D19102
MLSSVGQWDDVTAGVVLGRLALPGELAFFTPGEVAIAAPLLDLLLAQDGEPRIPVLALIDQRLAVGETDGWHYDDLPEDAQAWRATLSALDDDARSGPTGRPFAELPSPAQAVLVQSVHDLANTVHPDPGQPGRWHEWPAQQVWSLWTRYACTAFYSHPWAWNEIGFPGPAYPRGYLHAGVGDRERWERADRVDRDPTTFAQRVEAARREHDRLRGGG